NFDSLEVLIDTVKDADVLSKLLDKESDAKELNKIVSATTANYADLENMIPAVKDTGVLVKLLVKQSDAQELNKLVSITTANYADLEALIPTVNDISVLEKLLAKESDAKVLNKLVAVTTANYADLENMISKVADNSILEKLLIKQSDAKELNKIVDKAASNFDSLELLIEKLNNTDALVNLLTKESDAKKVKDKLKEIKAPLKEDGLDGDKAWQMFATLAEKDSLGPAEIETLMTTMRGHLKLDGVSTPEEKSSITDVKAEGTDVGEKILSGKEIEGHLRHTVDNGARAGKDIEKLFPTGQNFKGMSNDELWYYCALDHANVTPGFKPGTTTGAILKDTSTGADETADQAIIRQKLALKELKTKYGKPEAVQRMFFEYEGQKPRDADQPNVEDARAVSTNAHIQDRHVINNFGKIRNDIDLAYRITRHEPASCPNKAGAFNDLGHGQTEMQLALDYLYNNNLWPIWREEILTTGSKQGQIPCGTTSTHIFTGVKVGAAVLPRYIHRLGVGNQPMLPGENWTANMTSLANTDTMIVNNPQPGVAVAPGLGSVVITGGGNTFDFAGITAGPAGAALTAAEAAPAGVEVRIMPLDGAKGGFGFNSAWPY
ncbi:MAG: hypothetical protein J7604_18290, partial [Sporocytophaga sp.]|uniref:hypothetical protein n=1 Tax=Sporocytophaga sp. TaxID=2231183 RepID=UPI001AFF1AB8